MQNKSFYKKISVPTVTGAILMIIVVPLLVWAGPTGEPSSISNVDANFHSVKLPMGPKLTGSFGKFVGLSTTKTNGNKGGYAGMKTLCNSAHPESHVCSAKEIINTIEYTGAISAAPAVRLVWINNGPPAYVSDVSNDCLGWTMDNSDAQKLSRYGDKNVSVFGSAWSFKNNQASMTLCESELYVACCSY